ncbi:MAG: arginase family protein, partial [Chloroflexota bacterium]
MNKFPPFPTPARIGLLGVAFDENSSYKRGSALAPQRIREAFFCDSSNLWTENETYLGADGLFADMGDITPSAERMPIETEQAAGQLYEAGLKVMAFGGDHSVTYPLVKAAAKNHPDLTILHFDAHPDLYDDFEGNPH